MKQRFVVMKDKDFGTMTVIEFETLDEANRECIKRMKAEEDRWTLIKTKKPDFPRDALGYYRVEKR